jgi:GntR family transcriptional regulator/MocR family aminotransferase
LLEWAATNSAVIFEDDYDGEFRYDVAPMPALRAMSTGAERVIYLGTASKVLSRDTAIAWAVVPSWLRQTFDDRQLDDGGLVNAVAASALAAFIRAGSLARQIAHSHRTYAARRARFAAACRKLLPGSKLHGVDAGLHVVMTFADGLDDVAAVRDLRTVGLACAPLSDYFHDPAVGRQQGLVCGYSRLPETLADEAVAVIRETLGARIGREVG